MVIVWTESTDDHEGRTTIYGAFKRDLQLRYQSPLFDGPTVSVVDPVSYGMIQHHLRRANRHLLDAIETPPDTGEEHRLDDLAARIWAYQDEDCRCRPDPGMLCRLDRKLATLQRETTRRRGKHIERARERLRSCQATMDAVV
jgi:hypothetical protein